MLRFHWVLQHRLVPYHRVQSPVEPKHLTSATTNETQSGAFFCGTINGLCCEQVDPNCTAVLWMYCWSVPSDGKCFQHQLDSYWAQTPNMVSQQCMRLSPHRQIKFNIAVISWPARGVEPSGPPAQGSTLLGGWWSRPGCRARLSTAPGTGPGGPGWKRWTCSLFPRFAGTGSSGSRTSASSPWERPAWRPLWTSWRSWSRRTWSDLRKTSKPGRRFLSTAETPPAAPGCSG